MGRPNPGPRQSVPLFTGNCALVITGLTPGCIYTIEIHSVGGSTGYSEWSNPVHQLSL